MSARPLAFDVMAERAYTFSTFYAETDELLMPLVGPLGAAQGKRYILRRRWQNESQPGRNNKAGATYVLSVMRGGLLGTIRLEREVARISAQEMRASFRHNDMVTTGFSIAIRPAKQLALSGIKPVFRISAEMQEGCSAYASFDDESSQAARALILQGLLRAAAKGALKL